MSNRTNEYEKLLSYLDANLPARGTTLPVASKSKKQVRKPEVEVSKKETIKKSTKQLIEDSQIHGYIPPSENPIFKQQNKSVGFDVNAFEQIMRQKLIEEYKKIQTYERPYISVTEICSCLRAGYYNRLKYKGVVTIEPMGHVRQLDGIKNSGLHKYIPILLSAYTPHILYQEALTNYPA